MENPSHRNSECSRQTLVTKLLLSIGLPLHDVHVMTCVLLRQQL